MTVGVCDAMYERPGNIRPLVLHCTFPAGHENRNALPTEHSWDAIRCADIADTRVDYTPQAVRAYLDSITRGEMDAYLEAILAVAHNRKRAIRGTPGFRDGART